MLFAARVSRLLPPAPARLLGFAGFVVRRALREERCVQVAASLAFTVARFAAEIVAKPD